MYIYKATIKSGPMLEIKYYKSFRKRNKKNITRGRNTSRSNEKMKNANRIRAELNTQRLILCNFKPGDIFARFSAPYEKFTEQEFERVVKNFFRRVKTKAKKKNKEFKYIGYCECGKRGGNWHLHIIIENSIREIAESCWQWKNGVNYTPLYQDGNFKDLAKYIRKDVSGTKRLKTSRNLDKPIITVEEGKKREYKKIENGEMIETPYGYYFVKDSIFNYYDFTGASYNFSFMQMSESRRC